MSSIERRSGIDSRSESEKQISGERRSDTERRSRLASTGLMPSNEQLVLFVRRLKRAMRDEKGRSFFGESRLRKFEQVDKWSFCLKAAMIAANRRDHEQTTAPEPQPGFQGEGGACRRQGRPDDSSTGRALRRPPQSGDGLESTA